MAVRRTALHRLARAISVVVVAASTLLAPPVQSARATGPLLSAGNLHVEGVTNPFGLQTPTPRLSWTPVNDWSTPAQTAYQIQVFALNLDGGTNVHTVWDSGTVTSSATSVKYTGPALLALHQYGWKVRLSNANGTGAWADPFQIFTTGPIADTDWHGAQWITAGEMNSAPEFRHTFSLSVSSSGALHIPSDIAYATVTIAGLGTAKTYVNGAVLDDFATDNDELDAAYTNYNKRILFTQHSLNPTQLTSFKNTVGVALGSSWYHTEQADFWGTQSAPWRGPTMFRMLVAITYLNGDVQYEVSNTSGWTTSASETTWNSPYGGESVDLTSAQPGWSTPGFVPAAPWAGVTSAAPPSGALVAEVMPAMTATVGPTVGAPTHPSAGTWVYPVSPNVTGWAKIAITGTRGQVVAIDYDERLNSSGTVAKDMAYKVTSTPARWQHDEFTLTGGADVLQPRFTYKGFKYLQISGITAAIPTSNITIYAVHNAVPASGAFTSSDTLLNQLHAADTQTILNNWQGIESDCPTREKMGWQADMQLASENGMLNFDSLPLYEKLLADDRDAQQSDGYLPPLIPTAGWGQEGQAGSGNADPWWSGTIITLAWNLYRYFGDAQALSDNYAAMAAYVGYLARFRSGGSGIVVLNAVLGDWLAQGETSTQFTSTAALYLYARIMSSAATVLGKTVDAASYTSMATSVRDAINGVWFSPSTNGYVDTLTGSVGNTQAALALALALGIAPDDKVSAVQTQLVNQIAADHTTITTGIIGTKYLMQALDAAGRDDLAYDLIARSDGPGFGKMLANGATTIWEDWNAPFETVKLSEDHPALTGADAWLYQAVAGIHTSQYDSSVSYTIAPNPVAVRTTADATQQTPLGPLRSSWSVPWGPPNSTMTLTVSVPAGMTVTVSLPQTTRASVTEDGAPPVGATQVGDRVVMPSVPGGVHTFTSSYQPVNHINGVTTASSTTQAGGWSLQYLADGRDTSYVSQTAPVLGYHSAPQTSSGSVQWVILDQGTTRPVTSVTLWPATPSLNVSGAHTGWGFPLNFQIDVSDDGTFATSTTFDSEVSYPNPGSSPVTITRPAVSGRYVRLTATKLAPTQPGWYGFALAEVAAS